MRRELDQLTVRQNWGEISEIIKERWPSLTEADLEACRSNLEHLPERLLMRTDWDLDKALSEYEVVREEILNTYPTHQMYGERKSDGSVIPAEQQ